MNNGKIFLIFLVLLCIASVGIASVSASDIAADDASQSAIDDNAIDEFILEETDNTVSDAIESPMEGAGSVDESVIEDSLSGTDDKSLDSSILKDAETTIYVSTTGDDTKDGLTEENAVATVSKAYELAGDGSTINIGAGNYAVNGITVSKSITIKANEAGTAILDGNKQRMFTLNSPAELTLLNLVLCNGGTSGGGFVTLSGAGKVNIEGSRFENSTSSSSAAVISATDSGAAIAIKDSSFDNINCTNDYTLMNTAGNLRIERSNFTNIFGRYNMNWYGAIGLSSSGNAFITESQFINITGGDGAAIYFNSKGNLTVSKSVFMNIKNQRGAIYLSNNPASANINYNIFMDNEVATSSYAKDIYISSGDNVNASYNYWGVNSKPSSKEITKVDKAPVWAVLELSADSPNAILGVDSNLYLKFIARNGIENISLDEALPEYSFSLSASSGSIAPATVSIVNNEASASYTPAEEGTVSISTNPGSLELTLRVLDPSKLLVVSPIGNDETGDGTLDNPYASIAKALAQVTETRNVVYLLKSENAYKEHDLTISENVIFKCEDETVSIDAENQGRIFTVTGTLALEDLNLINGQSDAVGGAIYVDGGSLTLSNVKISNCEALNGGAIGIGAGSSLTVTDSSFTGNKASNGGAIYIDTESPVSISSNSFANNNASKGEAIYIKGASVTLSENEMTESNPIYLESGSVNSRLTFLSNKTISADFGEVLTLTATLTDDSGNAIRGGSVVFTADGIAIGEPVDLSGDSPLEITYTVPTGAEGDIAISGSYSLDNGGTVINGTVHPAVPHWFIEGGRGYEFLSQAVEAANDGDVIYGEPGTYTINGITIHKNITIKANEIGTIVLDGDRTEMFTVNSPAALTLLNLVLRNGGTQHGGFVTIQGEGTLNLINSTVKDLKYSGVGGLAYLESSGKLNIEGSHIENISSSNRAVIYAIRDSPVIIIKDSSFNNINNTEQWGSSALIEMRGNLTIERSNFTNVMSRKSDSYAYGAIGSSFLSNYYITECQFINITGGWGSSIYFANAGNITVSKSVFMNNKNYRGAIYLSDNPASANINNNLFIDNLAEGDKASDLFIGSANNLNADYNFWGTNNQPTASQITNVEKASYWALVELSSTSDTVYLGTPSVIDIKFIATNGMENISLEEAMPECSFDLSASSGTINPSAVSIVNNEASAVYTPAAIGTASITAALGPATLELNVVDPSVLIVVSNDGSDETGDGTLNNPYASIAKALSQVTESRNVIYILKSENPYKEHDLTVSDNLIIQGEDKTVTIDGENAGRIFIVTGNATIQNLKLINGQSDAVGGAIYVNGGNLTLTNVEISNSNAQNGGAIGTGAGSNLTVTDSSFTGNGANNGGAIYIDTDSALYISSNSFASNTADKGEAIYIKGASVTLSENTMTESNPIYLESGSVNSHLTFLSNTTIYEDFGKTIYLTATLTDDKGNTIRGGSVIFTADGVTVGTVDLSGDSPLQTSYTIPDTEEDIIISGYYTLDNGGTVLDGAIHPPILYWFIEGGEGYETLAQAIEAAQSGDVIYGKAGTYIVDGFAITKDLTIKANETGTIILDGNNVGMFDVSSSISLTLTNLDLTNGGSGEGGFVSLNGGTLNLINCTLTNIDSSRKGGAIYLDSEGTVNIEGCHFENIKSTRGAVIYTPSNMISVISIKDSSFNNINGSSGCVIMEIHGNLSIERSNFTNIKGSYGEINYGAIALPGYQNNAFISECQFINITGGLGSSIYLNTGNLTVTKSVFINNSNTQGTIYIYNSSSSKINYNLFIDNVCNGNNEGKDLSMNGFAIVNANYNFWGNNSQPTVNEITVPEKAAYWTIVELSASGSNAVLGDTTSIYVRFIGTNGVENVTLDDAMPEYSFGLSASSGSIAPGTVTLVNNEAIATYTPAETGTVTLTAVPGPAELVLDVIDPSDLIVVSNDGSDETGDGTLNNPYATIAKALSQVTESRNVIYILKSENAYKEHDLTISENVTIKCEDKTVTIDGENAGRIFIVTGTARIEDLTLMNGQSSENGGAIYVNGGDLTLSNCAFASNTALKGEAIYMESGSLSLSGNTIADDETIYIAGGTVNSILKFLDNSTVKAEFGETITLTATLTDDNGNAIRGGSVVFTADGETVGTVDLSGDSPLEIVYTAPAEANSDIVISGSYSHGGTVQNGAVHAAEFKWFIEGGSRYETLAQAIEAANDGDVIYGKPGTYDLTNIDIENDITIKANESGSIILKGNGNRLFSVFSNLTLINLTLADGATNKDGGLIYIFERGDLTAINTAFKDTISTSSTRGIAIYSKGSLHIYNSLFENLKGRQGAAIWEDSSSKIVGIENTVFNNINGTYDGGLIRSTFNVIISGSNFTNINGAPTSSEYGIFYITGGNLTLSESNFINITGPQGAVVYFTGSSASVLNITKCVFDTITCLSKGIIYSTCESHINYNVFLNVNQGINLTSSSLESSNIDNNYWGTNENPSDLINTCSPNNWVIMSVSPLSAQGIIDEAIEISIDFKHTINTAGEIGNLGDTLPEFTVYAESNDGLCSQAELTIVDSEAKLLFTPLLKGENIVNIACGSETIAVVITAAYKTSSHLQQLIDSTPEGGVLNLSNDKFENVSGINITKSIAIVADNVSISTAGDGNPVFSIASDVGNVSISGIEFVASNGDVIVKASAANGTDDLSIVNPAIELTNNTVTLANDDVVASSITLFELESERAVLAPSNPLSIADNSLPEGAKVFDFEIAGLNNGSDISIPQGGNINTNGSGNGSGNGTAPIVKLATKIASKNMKTTTVNTKINGKKAGKNFSITLKDSKGNVLAGKQVLISLNGKIYKRTTNAKGVASVKVALSKKGTYPVVVSFLGDDKYNGSFAVAKITVSPQKVKLTVAKKKYKASKKTKVLTATLKAANKKAIKGKKLVFIINKKKYTAKTNKKGIAKVKVKLSKRKTYKFTVKFAGDNTFKKISKKGKLVIK